MLLVIAGCGLVSPALDDHPVLTVRNGTDAPVDVILEFPDGSEVVVAEDLAAGTSISYDRLGDCEDATLVGRDESDAVVADKDGPICRPSEWTIEPP